MKLDLEIQQRKGFQRQKDRVRKKVQFTLSDKARAALASLAGPSGNRSFVVERLILAAAQAAE